MLFDLDESEIWAPELRRAVADLLPDDIESQLRALNPEYIEDARGYLLPVADTEALSARTWDWMCGNMGLHDGAPRS